MFACARRPSCTHGYNIWHHTLHIGARRMARWTHNAGCNVCVFWTNLASVCYLPEWCLTIVLSRNARATPRASWFGSAAAATMVFQWRFARPIPSPTLASQGRLDRQRNGSRGAMARGQQNQPCLATDQRLPTNYSLKKSKSMQTRAEKNCMGISFVDLKPNHNANSRSLNLALPSFSHKHTAQSHKPRCCLPSSASGCSSGVSASAASAARISQQWRGGRGQGGTSGTVSAPL